MYKLGFYKKAIIWAAGYPVPGIRKCRVLFDYLKLFRQKGITMQEYLDYEFDKCTEDFRQTFLGLNEQRYYLDYLNPIKYYSLSRNKYLAHKMLENTGVRKSALYCYYHPEARFIDSDINACDIASVLRILMGKNVHACVIKATEGSHGDSVEVVKEVIYGNGDAELVLFNGERKVLSSVLGSKPLIFEGVVSQTKAFADFNESSVNTVRCMTTLYPDGSARLIAAFFKIGRSGKCVDNAGSGGNVDACVDVETGEILRAIEFNGFHAIREIDCHPDNGNRINGVVIPGWESIKKQVCAFQKAFPYCKAAGWDIAITDDGPVVIEVNDMWDQIGQMFIGRGWRSGIRDCYLAWKKTGVKYPMARQRNELGLPHLRTIASHE